MNSLLYFMQLCLEVNNGQPSGGWSFELTLTHLLYESKYDIKNCLTLSVSDLIFLYLKHIFCSLIYIILYMYIISFIIYHIFYIIYIISHILKPYNHTEAARFQGEGSRGRVDRPHLEFNS